MAFDLTALRGELAALTFARVTKMVYDEKHVLSGTGPDRVFSHFCGFTRTVDNKKSVVWFKKFNHLPAMHIGPVTLNTSLQKFSEYPRTGDFIAGITKPSAKGDVFVWWVHRAKPIMELIEIVSKQAHFALVLRQSARTHSRLGHSDDLYLFTRLILGDIEPIVKQMLPEDQRPRHPVEKDASGYQRKRGFLIKRDPVAFAFFTAMFCRSEKMLESVFEAAEKEGVMDFGRYTMKRLKTMLDNAKPFD